MFQTDALFLFSGLLIGRRGLFLKGESESSGIRYFVVLLSLFFLCMDWAICYRDFIANKSILTPLLLIITSLSKFAFMLILVSGVIFAFYRTNLHDWLMKITPYGKMSLTNYITQSIIGSLLFYNWGLALHSQLGITASFLVRSGALHRAARFLPVVDEPSCARAAGEYLWKRATWLK